jgi:hypothetical protein
MDVTVMDSDESTLPNIHSFILNLILKMNVPRSASITVRQYFSWPAIVTDVYLQSDSSSGSRGDPSILPGFSVVGKLVTLNS